MSGFEELADGRIVWRDIKPENFRVDAAIYYEDKERTGHWLPHSVFGEWDGAGYTSDYDCDYVGGQLYYYEAGSGRPYANAHSEPDPCPARIWILVSLGHADEVRAMVTAAVFMTDVQCTGFVAVATERSELIRAERVYEDHHLVFTRAIEALRR